MHIPQLLETEDARRRAEDAARHFELAIAMQPQVCACISIFSLAASDGGHDCGGTCAQDGFAKKKKKKCADRAMMVGCDRTSHYTRWLAICRLSWAILRRCFDTSPSWPTR